MNRGSLATLFSELNDSGARYLVAGGLAVVAYGFVRLTMDVDLIIQLEAENLSKALRAMERLGYRPKVPVPITDFANPAHRQRWMKEKNMVVFQLVSDEHRTAPVDVFVSEPFAFDDVYARAPRREVEPGVEVAVVPLDELVAMKELANRPKDQIDVMYLRKIELESRDG